MRILVAIYRVQNKDLRWLTEGLIEVLILALKNELNWLAECIEGEIWWDGFDWCNILSMEYQRDLESKQSAKSGEK